ncbi:MAG: hypothetical protein ABSF83_13880 [Nitrososphaerales archaeon]|jgi:flagellar motility protein MotE (MotC chaperone)
MSAESNPQPPSGEEITFKEAVQLVGRKPDNTERKDLITLWGFAKQAWRWCIDKEMERADAIEVHKKLGEQYKVVMGKKDEKEREKKEKEMEKTKEKMGKVEKEKEKEREKLEKEREKMEKKMEKGAEKEMERAKKKRDGAPQPTPSSPAGQSQHP